MFFGAWVWILVLTCQSLAFSAWVRIKHLGAAMLFISYFGSTAFGAAMNAVLHTHWGSLIDISHLMGSVWVTLFGEDIKSVRGAVFFNVGREGDTPIWTCWMMLILLCGFCLVMLNKKIPGVEVVQGTPIP